MTLTVGSLFAGVGGFDIAAERAGMKVLWQSEHDSAASAVLDHHWPNLNLGDIHGIESPPAVDVLTGGFPCQDYSVAGNREGLAGDRGALWWEFHRLIASSRPTWVVGENVSGLLSSRGGQDFATIVDSLTERGYGVVWGVLDAQYFGVAQRRRRVFIVGHSGGVPRPEVLALSQGVFGNPAPLREAREKAGPITNGSTAGTLNTGFGPKWYSQTYQLTAGSVVANTVTTKDWHLDPGIGVGNVAYNPQPRRLTPIECERLQGFPDGWTNTEGNADTQRYKQLGNAVAVPVAQWIMENISAAHH